LNRKEIITELKLYFSSDEMVCPHTFGKFGEQSWQFFRIELLETLLIVRRDILQVPMTINTWLHKGQFPQRGLRCNLCKLVSDKTKAGEIYLSPHILGSAVDFDAKGMIAERARNIIIHHDDELPYPIRFEEDVSWVHMDVYDTLNGKISFFKA
jgi:hypothetical protein